jgi:hypothetical protein
VTGSRVRPAPPIPCNTREAESIKMFTESPQRIDAAKNRDIAKIKIFAEPNLSTSLP